MAMTTAATPARPTAEVEREMRAAERPLWVGYPIPGKFAIKTGMRALLFGIPWTAFCVVWELQAIRSGSIFMSLWGIPFIVIGFSMLASPLVQYWMAHRTIYVVSNQRLLILDGLLRPSVKSFFPSDIGHLRVDEAKDGSGSIIFSEKRTQDAEGGWNVEKIGFIAIAKVRDAEGHIAALKRPT